MIPKNNKNSKEEVVKIKVRWGNGKSDLKRNWRLRLETSMVSISMTSMFLNPDRARSLSNSHPKPPAPTTKTLASSPISSLNYTATNWKTTSSYSYISIEESSEKGKKRGGIENRKRTWELGSNPGETMLPWRARSLSMFRHLPLWSADGWSAIVSCILLCASPLGTPASQNTWKWSRDESRRRIYARKISHVYTLNLK